MHDGGETAVARCAERDALDRVRPVAGAVVHLAPRQHHLDRPSCDAGAERRQRHMRPGPQRRAERAADEGRDDADVLCRNAEHRGDLVGHVVHPLRLVPEGQAIAVPGRDRRVHLDRVVVLARDHVGLVDLHLGGRRALLRDRRAVSPSGRRSPWSVFCCGRPDRLDAGDVGDRRFRRRR